MNNNTPISPEAAPRVIMIICGALIGGCLLLLTIMLFIAKMQPNWLTPGPVTIAVLVVGIANIGLASVLPGMLSRSMVNRSRELADDRQKKPDTATLLRIATSAAMNQCIIRYGLLEGAAFFAMISLMIEGSWLALGMALLLVATMLAFFPWPSRFESVRDGLIDQMKS